ncbi:MAG: hypothetical protein SH819_10060 [Cytophagales bacterium]|nr:hypothetical protein [Cytophagales bacterium]
MATIVQTIKKYNFLIASLFINLFLCFPALLNRGIFWDDWTLYHNSPAIIIKTFSESGYPWFAYPHIYFSSFENSIALYRVIVLGASLFTTILFSKLLEISQVFNKTTNGYLLILFVVMPFFACRFLMISVFHGICLSMFLGGLYLFAAKNDNLFFRIISLALFFLSFSLNSLLVFYGVIFLCILNKYGLKQSNLRILSKHIDFIILPIVFWVSQSLAGHPSGLYMEDLDYNQIHFNVLTKLPAKYAMFVNDSLLGIVSEYTKYSYPYFSILLILGITIVFFRNRRQKRRINISSNLKSIPLLVIAVILLTLSVAAYLMVRKIPSFYGFENRHQVLLPISASFLIISMSIIFIKENMRVYVLIFIIGISFYLNLYYQYRYLIGWMKNESIVYNFKSSDTIRNSSTFIVYDHVPMLSATNRELTHYEYSGMSKVAFNNQEKLYITQTILSNKEITALAYINRYFKHNIQESYNIKDYAFSDQAIVIHVRQGKKNLESIQALFRCLYLYYFDHNIFLLEIGDYLTIETDSNQVPIN